MFLFWGMLARERLWAATFVVYKYIMLKGCFLDGEVMMKENERKKLGKFEDFGLFWNFGLGRFGIAKTKEYEA